MLRLNRATGMSDTFEKISQMAFREAARVGELTLEVSRLNAENARLRKALNWYANPKSWKAQGHPQIDADTKPILDDHGRRARKALKENSDE